MRIAIVEDNAAQAAELVRMTEACAPFACEIGEEDVYSDADAFLAARRSYDLALITIFENREAFEAYQTHPAHLPVKKRMHEVRSGSVACDFEF